MKFDAELVARNITVSEIVHVDESLVLHSPGELAEGVRVERGGQSIADDLAPDGTVRSLIKGKSPQGREGEREACQILIERLNRGRTDGEKWRDLTEQREDSPVDWEASAPPPRGGREPSRLRIQVTLVGDSDFWQRLNTVGQIEEKSSIADLREALYAAIRVKSTRSSPDIVLAINARDTPRHSFRPVVDSFREQHAGWAAEIGFQEIWVVGPIPDMTERLDLQ